jgi:type I restriction enzyme, S subunit
MSPFDAARYARLLKGLEISEVRASRVHAATSTLRFDPEYFQAIHLRDEALIAARSKDFMSFANLGLIVDASAFYPSIEGYYGEGSFPFLRVADVDSVIDFDGCTRVPEKLCDMYPTLARVNVGDILFTKGGSVARIGLVTKPAAVSRDLIFLNSSKLSREDQAFLYLYAQTQFFNRLLLRSSSQTAQPHLTITLVRELRVLRATEKMKRLALLIVEETFKSHVLSAKHQEDAEKALLNALGLEGWQAPEPLSYVRQSSEAFASGRLDAQHFQPRFKALTNFIDATGEGAKLSDWLSVNQRGKQPQYVDDGLPVVNSKHVLRGEVRLDADNRRATFDMDDLLIQQGDVLFNGTGVGTIGRSAPYLHASAAIPDNHVTILRPKAGLDAVYLSVFLNTMAGQWQVEQRLRGSSGQIELYPNDIAEFKVWVAPVKVQSDIRKAVEKSYEQKQRAAQLLDAAKRAVEIAIEDSETAALDFLEKFK